MKYILAFILLCGTAFGQTPKAIKDFPAYSSPLNSGGILPISINNATRSIDVYWINRGSIDSLKTIKLNVTDTAGLASRAWVIAQNYLKAGKQVTSVSVTGTNTKTVTLSFADNTSTTATFTDLQGTGGGTFTFTGTSSQYVAGDGSYITSPTIPTTTSQLTNNSGFLTSSSLSPYALLSSPVFSGTPKIGTDTVATRSYARSVGGGSGGGSAILYSTTGSNADGAMTQAATTAALGAKQDTAGAKIYFDSNDFYKDGATSSTALRVKGKADSITTAIALSGKQGTLTLTTTGTSGAATLTGNTLNIPNYATTGGGGGGSVGTAVGANMYRLASQSFTGGADTKVLFDNTDFDNDGTVADLTNNRFNITTTGIYIIAIQARLNTVASGEHVIKASKNGTTELLRAVQYEYNSGIATQMNGSMVVKLTAGDYVEMFVNVPTTTSSIGSISAVSPRMSIAQIK